MDARFREADDPLASRLSHDVRLCVYRVIEQGIDNVLRHAQAATLRIALTLSDEDMIGVTVEDDGRGLDPVNVVLGVGLSTVSGRVELLGGQCSLEATESGGARLRLSLPLELKPPG